MDAARAVLDADLPVVAASTVPFAGVYVTLTKAQHIELVMEARTWKSRHERAVSRLEQVESSYKRFVRQLREHGEQREAALRAELDLAQAKVRDLEQRLFGRKSERSKGGTELQSRPLQPRAPRDRGATDPAVNAAACRGS